MVFLASERRRAAEELAGYNDLEVDEYLDDSSDCYSDDSTSSENDEAREAGNTPAPTPQPTHKLKTLHKQKPLPPLPAEYNDATFAFPTQGTGPRSGPRIFYYVP